MASMTSAEEMDQFLKRLGKWRKRIVRDGSCLFRAVSDHLYGCQAHHEAVRAAACDLIEAEQEHYKFFVDDDMPIASYLAHMRTDATWGGHVEIDALKRVYGLEFTIFRELPTVGVDPQFEPPVEEDALAEASSRTIRRSHIEVCYAGDNHYDLVYPARFHELATTMQGLIYQTLADAIGAAAPATPHVWRDAEYLTWTRPPPKAGGAEVMGGKKNQIVIEVREKKGKGRKGRGRKKQVLNLDLGESVDDQGGGTGAGQSRRGGKKPPDSVQEFPTLGGRVTPTVGSAAVSVGASASASAQPTGPTTAKPAVGGWGGQKNWASTLTTKEFPVPPRPKIHFRHQRVSERLPLPNDYPDTEYAGKIAAAAAAAAAAMASPEESPTAATTEPAGVDAAEAQALAAAVPEPAAPRPAAEALGADGAAYQEESLGAQHNAHAGDGGEDNGAARQEAPPAPTIQYRPLPHMTVHPQQQQQQQQHAAMYMPPPQMQYHPQMQFHSQMQVTQPFMPGQQFMPQGQQMPMMYQVPMAVNQGGFPPAGYIPMMPGMLPGPYQQFPMMAGGHLGNPGIPYQFQAPQLPPQLSQQPLPHQGQPDHQGGRGAQNPGG